MVVLLGFIDDVIDLRWRHKLIVPTIATFPLLVAYSGLTSVVVPTFFQGVLGKTFEISIFYYMYMGNLSVFCTNAINIYAGINGIEVGQSFIIACFIMIHNIIVSTKLALNRYNFTGAQTEPDPRDLLQPPVLAHYHDPIRLYYSRPTETQCIPE